VHTLTDKEVLALVSSCMSFAWTSLSADYICLKPPRNHCFFVFNDWILQKFSRQTCFVRHLATVFKIIATVDKIGTLLWGHV